MKRLMGVAVMVAMMLWASGVHAEARAVPTVLAFQSVLTDDGGNPIADGEVEVTFRITDLAGLAIYEEVQTLEAVDGHVAALVGAGLDASGAPTGGLGAALLDPREALLLEVAVEGLPPLPAMEIASVPYAAWAERALAVQEGAIDSSAIADGAIAFDDLSAALVDRLASELAAGEGSRTLVMREELDDYYRDPASAAHIGVEGGFSFSGANDLQGVLADIDRAMKRRDERVSAEEDAREEATTTLQANIDIETQARVTWDGTLQANIDGESAARVQADLAEAQARSTWDGTLQTNIDGEAALRASADTALQAAIDAEAEARRLADDAINQRINGMDPALNPPELPQFHANAWGSVCASMKNGGGNFSVAANGVNSVRVTFGVAMPHEHYALVVTPLFEQTPNSGNMIYQILDKTAGGYTYVSSGASACFDFIVIAQ